MQHCGRRCHIQFSNQTSNTGKRKVHEGFTAAYHHQVRHVEIFSLKKKRHRDFLEIFSLKKKKA
jgi:hypothetical protein